jgi:hypothetical protein
VGAIIINFGGSLLILVTISLLLLRYHHTIDGKELPGAPNYKYYGAAKELPGVRELFAELEEVAEKKRLHRFKSHLALLFSSPIYLSLLCCLSPAL